VGVACACLYVVCLSLKASMLATLAAVLPPRQQPLAAKQPSQFPPLGPPPPSSPAPWGQRRAGLAPTPGTGRRPATTARQRRSHSRKRTRWDGGAAACGSSTAGWGGGAAAYGSSSAGGSRGFCLWWVRVWVVCAVCLGCVPCRGLGSFILYTLYFILYVCLGCVPCRGL